MFFSVDVTFSVQFLSYYILRVKCSMGICVLDMSVVLPHRLFNRLLAGSVLSLLQNSASGGNQFPLPGHMRCIVLYCLEVVDISDLSSILGHTFPFFSCFFFFLFPPQSSSNIVFIGFLSLFFYLYMLEWPGASPLLCLHYTL